MNTLTQDKNKLNFTLADLEQWAEKGLISPDQSRIIGLHIEAMRPVREQAQAGPEQAKGLNLVTVAYYFGGFMILLAYTIFMGLQWELLSLVGQVVVSFLTIVFLWAIGFFLQTSGFKNGGGLLIFAGTGIVPLLVYSAQQATGFWPTESIYVYHDFYRLVAPA